MYTVAFSDWNVAPKFTAADFAFKPPAGAEEVDELIEPDPPHPLLGKPAPLFKTVDLDGHPFDLKNHLGKDVILLDFWSTSCGPCIMLMPALEAVAEKYADRGLVYRAINGGEDAASIKDFLAATKIKAPIVLDPELQTWRAYQVEPIPQTVLIGKDGKVQVVHLGYSEALAGEISKEVEALLAGKDLAGEELGKRKKPQKQPK
jgi:thiol-disulfide isomerase/thioredoxin